LFPCTDFQNPARVVFSCFLKEQNEQQHTHFPGDISHYFLLKAEEIGRMMAKVNIPKVQDKACFYFCQIAKCGPYLCYR
jgi:hypothetical protein